MNELPTLESPGNEESERQGVVQVAVLSRAAEGTYDMHQSPREIAAETGLDESEVRNLAFAMIGRKEIRWARNPRTGITGIVPTEAGEELLARLAEV